MTYVSFFRGKYCSAGCISDLGTILRSLPGCAIMGMSVRASSHFQAHPVVESTLIKTNGDTKLCYVTTTAYRIRLIGLRWIPLGISRNKGPDTEILVSSWQLSCTFTCHVSRLHTACWCQRSLCWLFPFNLSWQKDAQGIMNSGFFIISLQMVLLSPLTGSYRETVALQSNTRTALCAWKVTEMTENRNNAIMASPGDWLVNEPEVQLWRRQTALCFQERPHLNHLRDYVKT